MAANDTAPVARRHRLLALIVAGTCCALLGAFVLLWVKLPVWAPDWVVEHSPWADPIVRAVEAGGRGSGRAAERLGRMGAAQVPRLLALIDHPDPEVRALVAASLERIQDVRVIGPLFDRLLADAKDGDVWIRPLTKQDPSVIAGLLVPYLTTGKLRSIDLLSLAGTIVDDRVVAPLQAIMEQPWEAELLDDNHLWVQPTTLAAMALMASPCASAEPALLRSFADPDPVVRRRVVLGIHMDCYQSARKRRQWDARLQDLLLRALADPDPTVRYQAASLMNMQRIEGAEPILIAMSGSPDGLVRRSAILGLNARWYGSAAHRKIVECLRDPEPKVQLFAIIASRQVDDPPPTTELLELLRSPDERVRDAACSTLQRKIHLDDSRIFPALLRMMDDPSRSVARRAELGLYAAASTPAQKQAAIEASQRLKERNELAKPTAGSSGAQ
jgi:HEAT repeat protein